MLFSWYASFLPQLGERKNGGNVVFHTPPMAQLVTVSPLTSKTSSWKPIMLHTFSFLFVRVDKLFYALKLIEQNPQIEKWTKSYDDHTLAPIDSLISEAKDYIRNNWRRRLSMALKKGRLPYQSSNVLSCMCLKYFVAWLVGFV